MHEHQLAQFLEGTADAAFAADMQGEIRTWNRVAEELFGYPDSTAVGSSCAEIVGGSTAGGATICCELCDVLECVRSGRGVSNFDMMVRNRSGQHIWVNVSLLFLRDEKTGRQMIVHLMRDISVRKKAEDLTSKMLEIAKEIVNGSDESNGLPPVSPLTVQEAKILRLLAAGKITKDVTSELHISAATLRNHVSNINRKLHTKSRTEAVAAGLTRRLI